MVEAMGLSAQRTLLRHSSGFTLELPNSWEVRLDPHPQVQLVTREPEESAATVGFGANLVVTVDEVPMGLDEWQRVVDDDLVHVLGDYTPIELRRCELGGHAGIRRVGHHRVGEDVAVTVDQWATVVDDLGYSFTFTTATSAYAGLVDDLQRLVDSIRIENPGDSP